MELTNDPRPSSEEILSSINSGDATSEVDWRVTVTEASSAVWKFNLEPAVDWEVEIDLRNPSYTPGFVSNSSTITIQSPSSMYSTSIPSSLVVKVWIHPFSMFSSLTSWFSSNCPLSFLRVMLTNHLGSNPTERFTVEIEPISTSNISFVSYRVSNGSSAEELALSTTIRYLPGSSDISANPVWAHSDPSADTV